MKRIGILFLSFILCMPVVARGEVVSLIDGKEDADRISNMPIFQGVNDISDFFEQELEIIEERVRLDNPDLVEAVKTDNDNVKIIKYNNWYAQKIFYKYRDLFMARLNEQSQKSGRKIKSSFYPDLALDYQYEYWLDEGELDTDKCSGNATYKAKNTSREEVEKELDSWREHVCLYPDGFEEHRIQLRDEDMNEYSYLDRAKMLSVYDDFAADGIRLEFDINLFYSQSQRNCNDPSVDCIQILHFDVAYDIYSYQEYHDYRNQNAQDIKDGMFSFIPKERRKCDTLYNCPLVGIEDVTKWKSSILPTWHTTSQRIDFLGEYNKTN